jgi:hypothetical protein
MKKGAKGKGPDRPEPKKSTVEICPDCGRAMSSPMTCEAKGCGKKVCGICYRDRHRGKRCLETRACIS